jgi:polar amino acid transport system permease protein
MKNTGLITLFGFIIGSLIGTVIAVVRVIPPYEKLTRYGQKICSVYVAFFRGTPIVVQLLLGYYILLPLLGVHLDPVASCTLIFGLNSGAYISEIMRGGIQSVDAGQLEAARALGLNYPISMLKIVIPQAVKNVIPAIGNELIALIKETSIVSMVSIYDLTMAAKDIGSGKNLASYLVPMLVVALFYLAIVYLLTFVIKIIERRLRAGDKR